MCVWCCYGEPWQVVLWRQSAGNFASISLGTRSTSCSSLITSRPRAIHQHFDWAPCTMYFRHTLWPPSRETWAWWGSCVALRRRRPGRRRWVPPTVMWTLCHCGGWTWSLWVYTGWPVKTAKHLSFMPLSCSNPRHCQIPGMVMYIPVRVLHIFPYRLLLPCAWYLELTLVIILL